METAVWDSYGVREISVQAILTGRRLIFLRGMITEGTAMDFMDQIMYFSQDDGTHPVKVFICSSGGSIDAGMIIYDIIQTSSLPMDFYCIGTAYSMAAVILAGGRKGHRFILPHSKVMIHEPLIISGVAGKSSSVRTISDRILQTKRQMEEILSLHTGQSLERLDEITRTDCYFNAEEAKEFGLVDGIMGFDEMLSSNQA